MPRKIVVDAPFVSVIEPPKPPPSVIVQEPVVGRSPEEIVQGYGASAPASAFASVVQDAERCGFNMGSVVCTKQQESRNDLYNPLNWGMIVKVWDTTAPGQTEYKPLEVRWLNNHRITVNHYGYRSFHFKTELVLIVPAGDKKVLWDNINRAFMIGED